MAVSKKAFIEKYGTIFLTIILVIIGGIVGYFSGIISLKSEITDLRVDLMRLETQIEENSKQNSKTIQNHETRITKNESDIEKIKDKPNPTDNSPDHDRIILELEYYRFRIKSKS